MSKPRVPPYSIESEQAILAGLLIDNATWHRVSDLIAEAHFYREEHRYIYRHIRQLLEQGRPATPLAVANALDAMGEVDKAGGIDYLHELAGEAASADGIRELAETVAEKYLLRQLLTVADEIAADALNPHGRHPDELFVAAETRIADLAASQRRQRSDLCHINPLLAREVECMMDQRDRESESNLIGFSSGFADLDKMTLGFQGGDLILVAGRPAMGKTSFALNLARHFELAENRPVLIFSMEGESEYLTQRMLSCAGKIDTQMLRRGKLSDEEWSRVASALGALHEVSIYNHESEVLSYQQLRSVTKSVHRQYGGGPMLIVVDFIQLMASRHAGAQRAEELFDVCRALKALAKELDVTIVALSELPGTVEQRADKRPMLCDLMDCGPVEQVADLILMLYRDEYYHADSPEQGTVELIIAKQRNGPTGKVRLAFNAERGQFDDISKLKS